MRALCPPRKSKGIHEARAFGVRTSLLALQICSERLASVDRFVVRALKAANAPRLEEAAATSEVTQSVSTVLNSVVSNVQICGEKTVNVHFSKQQ